jgi:uncharacterized protein
MTPILIVPGYRNSDLGHWQSLWEEELPACRRVPMPSWEQPERGPWLEALDEAIAAAGQAPILVGHGLGCIAIVHWAAVHERTVRGALLAAPVDVERLDIPEPLRRFAPMPRSTLPFPAIVAASSDDPCMRVDRAHELAAEWGADFVNLGPCGHLNEASGHGPWVRGEALLSELR